MPLFWVLFGVLMAIAGFLGIVFVVRFDFFRNNPDVWVLILIFLSMTLWNAACRALVSYFLQSVLTYSCKKE